MKELINKRDGLVNQAEEMRKKLNDEKRTSFTSEERSAFDQIKNQITELNQRIADEQFIDEQNRNEAAKVLKTERKESGFNLERAFRDFAAKSRLNEEDQNAMEAIAEKEGVSLKRGQFYVPASVVRSISEKRAAQLSSSVLTNTVEAPKLSYAQSPILYQQMGCNIQTINNSKLDLKSLADFTVTINGEGQTVTNVSLSPAHAVATPNVINVTAGFTREMLASTSQNMMDQILNKFVYKIDKSIDKLFAKAVTGISQTITGVTTFANILTLEASLVSPANAFVCSYKGRNYWKNKLQNPSGTDATFVWQKDNTVGGYSAYAAPSDVLPNGFVALLDAGEVNVVKFGGLILIEDPFSSKSTNTIEYSAIQLADVKIPNSAFVAYSAGGSYI